RYLEAGDSPFDAALKGSKQIGFTVISLTISLIAALIPLLFMSDVIGRLFRAFAATLAITILISAVVALTLVPMLSARYLTSTPSNPPLFQRRVSAAFERVREAYGRALDWVLAHQNATLGVFAATLVATAVLAIAIPKGLFPVQDTGQLEAFVVASQEVSFARMAQLQSDVAGVVLADPEVENLSSSIGVDGRNPALNQGRMLINLKPKSERGNQADLIERLQQAARNVAGVTLYVRPVQDLTIDAEDGPTQYRLALQGTDAAELSRWGHALMAKLADEPKVRNVVSDIFDGGKAVTVNIDRVNAARLGINTAAIDSALYDAFGQRIVTTIFTHATQYRVVLESEPSMLKDPNALDRLYIPTGSGPAVPLGMVATVSVGDAPLTIARTAHFPSATIGFDPAPGVSLGAAVDAVARAVQELGLPPTVSTKFLGAADAFRTSLAHEGWLIVAAIVVVYIVLGVLYESFIHPVTILSTLPAAAIGALLALMITRDDLGVLAVIGIVLLIGIVKKNAIMMIDFALHAQREEKLSPTEAIKQAALLRFRPIMMTTFAALFAALPLIFGTGMGSEMRAPVGVSIAGGLILSQALTLFTTPVVFLAFTRLTARRSRAAPQFAAAPNRADEVASP
ncbi:MAG TPA: efflux RND transporter permease subunit, partial [Pseudomonadales bacterium]|nr:efflux RND transporter permease subunit [Pseudomonadales bacterium]